MLTVCQTSTAEQIRKWGKHDVCPELQTFLIWFNNTGLCNLCSHSQLLSSSVFWRHWSFARGGQAHKFCRLGSCDAGWSGQVHCRRPSHWSQCTQQGLSHVTSSGRLTDCDAAVFKALGWAEWQVQAMPHHNLSRAFFLIQQSSLETAVYSHS